MKCGLRGPAEVRGICAALCTSFDCLSSLVLPETLQTGASVFREADLQIDYLILLDHLPIEKVNESVSARLQGNMR